MHSSENKFNVNLRFYGDLKDWITVDQEAKTVERTLSAPTSVKDLIEGCGIPHTEVDLILVKDTPVDFSYLIEGGERISVYPFFNSLDIPASDRLQERIIHPVRFIVDVNLGKLARYLRLTGFDTAYKNDADDPELIQQMQAEKRILLTRDRKLLMYKVVEHGYLPRSDDPITQLKEVFLRFDLKEQVLPYTRCMDCNGKLRSVDKSEILDDLEPLTKKYHNEFSRCEKCGKIYWPGSHRKRLDTTVRNLMGMHDGDQPE